MNKPIRVAVIGLYNSGSTGIAGMLHRLGVNMGPPFWASNNDNSDENFYEPYDLARHLRRWWNEPHATEHTPAVVRRRFLTKWAHRQECVRPGPIGAKHPLLSLCGHDLAEAWGTQVRLVWSWRELDRSIQGLQRRGWFGEHGETLQITLWEALSQLASQRPDVMKLDWSGVKSDPAQAAKTLAEIAGLEPSRDGLASAVAFIRHNTES